MLYEFIYWQNPTIESNSYIFLNRQDTKHSSWSIFSCTWTLLSVLLQNVCKLHGERHLRVRWQLPGAFHQVQLLQHHPHHHERSGSHCQLDVHLRAQEHLLQRGLQRERRHAAGAGQGQDSLHPQQDLLQVKFKWRCEMICKTSHCFKWVRVLRQILLSKEQIVFFFIVKN